jgi:hypothetical protein
MLRAALLAAIVVMALAASSPSNHWIIDRPPYRTATSPKLAFAVPEMLTKVLVGNNISHSGSEIYMAESGSAFVRAPALSSMLRREQCRRIPSSLPPRVCISGENSSTVCTRLKEMRPTLSSTSQLTTEDDAGAKPAISQPTMSQTIHRDGENVSRAQASRFKTFKHPESSILDPRSSNFHEE